MSAFAIAVPLCIFYPELQAPLLVLSLSIAVSRVILGMHFVSDVVVGSLLGAWAGLRVVSAVPVNSAVCIVGMYSLCLSRVLCVKSFTSLYATRSKIPAAPMPPPMHIVTMP